MHVTTHAFWHTGDLKRLHDYAINSLLFDTEIEFEYGLRSASPKYHVGITPNVCIVGLTIICTLLQRMDADLTPKCLKNQKVIANVFQIYLSQGDFFLISLVSCTLNL
jgi:hypothetical protein